MNQLAESIVKLALHVAESAPETARSLVAALAPHLHAKARVTLRVDIVTDGAGGPLPDPVVTVSQAAYVSAEGLQLMGAPEITMRATGGTV